MDKTTFSQELANTTDTIPFWTGYSYYMRDKEPRYPLERRDLLDIAMHLLGAVQKIRGRADGVITLMRPDDLRPLEISFGPTGLPHGGFRHIRAEGLIDTHGTFGASWPHLLLSIATKRALEITDGLSSVDSRQAVRADAARAITLMKPDALADARKRVSAGPFQSPPWFPRAFRLSEIQVRQSGNRPLSLRERARVRVIYAG